MRVKLSDTHLTKEIRDYLGTIYEVFIALIICIGLQITFEMMNNSVILIRDDDSIYLIGLLLIVLVSCSIVNVYFKMAVVLLIFIILMATMIFIFTYQVLIHRRTEDDRCIIYVEIQFLEFPYLMNKYVKNNKMIPCNFRNNQAQAG